MTIRITSQIVKADPKDTYSIVDLDDVKGADTLKQDVKAATKTAEDAAAEAGNASKALAQVTEGLRVMQSNLDLKPDGIHIEDRHGNSFDDVTALNFGSENVTIPDVQQANANIVIDNLVTVSNGQEPDSVSMTGKVLEFPDATLMMRDPQGAKVIVISQKTQDDQKTPIIIDNQTANFSIAGVKKIELPTTEILAKGGGVYALTPYVTVGQQEGGTDDVLARRITAQRPLQVQKQSGGTAVVGIDPAFLEKEHVSYYAYLDQGEEIAPKRKSIGDASLWFDDSAVRAGAFIEIDRDQKLIGIQETDSKDPNLTGGSSFLVIFRVAMRGTAPEDGTVKIYLEEFDQLRRPVGILEDENGKPCGVERVYQRGEELGVLEVVRVVKAKTMTYVGLRVSNPFVDPIFIGDRTEGNSCIVIQEISSRQRTGLGFLQFENDTAQSIPFTRHYLGAAHATIAALVSKDIPTQEGKAGEAYTLADGWGASNRTKLTLGISGGAIVVSSVSSEMADFTIHKIFSAEDTVLMRGKEERVTVTTENRDCAFVLLGMKWTGKPDEATTEILVNRNNGSPVFAPDWAEFDREFISENALTDSTVSHVFTVPPDATQYAYVLIPNAEQNPINLKIKQFVCDVVAPFESHIVHRPKLIETMMRKEDEFWEFAQDNQGYFSLRYTVNAVWIPCPIGLLKKGASLLKLDASKMVIAGSAAKGGEGAIVFPDAGKVTMAVSFFALNEQATDSEFSARLVKVADSGAVTPIAGADLRVKISANSKGSIVNLKADTFDVSAGDCVGIQVKSDKVDGCFLESTTPSQPLVLTTIEYLRVV